MVEANPPMILLSHASEDKESIAVPLFSHLDKRGIIARDVQEVGGMIDIHSMRASRWKRPVLD